ncbi:MAG: type IV secretory system conjugative DNA transfer family protein [Clostridia bacterium]|nr:type IV secretory system conjugative DNA transfer family protein [Clostridia bacterium]
MLKKLRKLKKELITLAVIYLVADIYLLGAIFVASLSAETPNLLNTLIVHSEEWVNMLKNPFGIIGGIFTSGEKFGVFLQWSFWLLVICLGIYIAYKIKNSKDGEYDGIEVGSSDWATGGEEFDKTENGKEILNRKEGFILSKTHYLGTDLKKVLINKNVLVVGGSGAGKSACYVKPNILQLLGSYVITDPKGELYRETSGFLKSRGYNVRALNLVNPNYSDRYNPLAHIIDDKSVDEIASTIITGGKGESNSQDPFWDNTAKMLLKACIYYVISVLPEEEQNLSSCLNIIRQGGSDSSVFERLFIGELKPTHPGRTQYENFKTAADKTMQSIVISTISKVEIFDTPAIKRITTSNNIDFEELGRSKTALFVITSAADSTYDYISTIFFAQMLQKMFLQADHNGGTLPCPVYFLLDEFPNIGQIPDFPRKLSVTRSLGISISIIVQNLDQLEALYKDQYEVILGNCDTHLFLGSQSVKTCEYFNKSLGQKTIMIHSKSVSKDKSEMEKQGVSISEQRQGRDLMTVDELKRMSPDDEILIIRTLKPIKAKKAWYYKYHPLRDEARKYEIRDITEMPKTDEVPIRAMDIEEHFANRVKIAKQKQEEVAKANSNITFENEVEAKKQDAPSRSKPEEASEEYDLQKELERKFDELFGTSSNDVE